MIIMVRMIIIKMMLMKLIIMTITCRMTKNQQNFWCKSATNLPAYLRIIHKSPCLFANLPAYLRQKFCLFLLIRLVDGKDDYNSDNCENNDDYNENNNH